MAPAYLNGRRKKEVHASADATIIHCIEIYEWNNMGRIEIQPCFKSNILWKTKRNLKNNR